MSELAPLPRQCSGSGLVLRVTTVRHWLSSLLPQIAVCLSERLPALMSRMKVRKCPGRRGGAGGAWVDRSTVPGIAGPETPTARANGLGRVDGRPVA